MCNVNSDTGDGALVAVHSQREELDMRILVVDDERSIGAVLRRIIEEKYPRAEVVYVDNGTEAMSIMSAQDLAFDVVITDNIHPGDPGMEMIERIHRQHGHRVTIIMLTATDRLPCPDVYLRKPATRTQLELALELCIGEESHC